ncbi:MAG: hypothetical protein ABSA27_13850 [Terriglobales bacterium]
MGRVAAEPAAARGDGHILMSRTRKWIVLGLVLAAPATLAHSLPAQTDAQPAAPATTPHHKSHKTQKAPNPVVLPPLPSGPLSQLPMDQIPATKATVSFDGGLLTIAAQNSTLGEILRDVRRLTGASIEIPQGSAASERVVTHLGPGAPRDVMAVLLNGSSFDYVMLGSSSDPTAVSSVILIAKPSGPGDNQAAANGPQGNPGTMPANGARPQPFNRQVIAGQPGNGQLASVQEDSKDDDSDTADDNSEDQAQPGQPAQPDTTGANANVNVQDQQQPPDPNQPNAGPKTPEQILEMMQKQRQQQPGAAVPPPQPPPQQ